MTVDPRSPASSERLDQFVSNLSRYAEVDIKERLTRLNTKERKYLDVALKVFRSADPAALARLNRLGDVNTLTRIQKILQGEMAIATQGKVKQLAVDTLYAKIEEAKAFSKTPFLARAIDGAAIVGTSMPIHDAQGWLASLKQFAENKNRAIQLSFLEVLNQKGADQLLRKLYLSVLTGTEVMITPEEADCLEKFSALKNVNQDQKLGNMGVVRLWFLGFMSRQAVKNLLLFANRGKMVEEMQKLREGYQRGPFTQVQALSLSYQLGVAEDETHPLVLEQVKKGGDQLEAVFQARQAREISPSYSALVHQVFQLGEMDEKLSLLKQAETRLKEAMSKPLSEGKKVFFQWAEGNTRRKELLEELIGAVNEAEKIETLGHISSQSATLFNAIKGERGKLYQKLLENGSITADGQPHADPGSAGLYLQALGQVEDAENALLVLREAALYIATESALFDEAKGDPTLLLMIQKRAETRKDQIERNRVGLDPDSRLGQAYAMELAYLNEQLTNYWRPSQRQALRRIETSVTKHLGELQTLTEKLNEAETELKQNKPKENANLDQRVKSILVATHIYPTERGAKIEALDAATKRRNFFYMDRGSQVPMNKRPFQEHEAQLLNWGLKQEQIPDLFTLMSGSGQALIFERATLSLGPLAGPYQKQEGIGLYQFPHLALVKNVEGNYELYLINLSKILKEPTSSEVQGYDIGIIRVIFNGEGVEAGKPFAETVIGSAISPPLQVGKRELEGMAATKIGENGEIPPEGEKMLVEVLLDSIQDTSFREGARSVITSYQSRF